MFICAPDSFLGSLFVDFRLPLAVQLECPLLSLYRRPSYDGAAPLTVPGPRPG